MKILHAWLPSASPWRWLKNWLAASIANRIMVAAAMLALGVMVLIGVISHLVISNLMAQRLELQLQSYAHMRAARVASLLEAIDRDLVQLASTTLVTNALSDSVGREQYLAPFLSDYRAPAGTAVRIHLLDFRAEPLVLLIDDPAFTYRGAPWTAIVLATGKPYVTLESQGPNKRWLTIVHPVVYPATGTVEGFLIAQVALGAALSVYGVEEPFPVSYRLLAGGDQLLAQTGSMPSGEGQSEAVAVLKLPPHYAPLQLKVAVSAPTKTANLPLDSLLAAYLLAWPLILLWALWGSIRISRRLTAPLLTLSKAAARATLENLDDLQVPATGRDEVGRLGSALALMVRRLRAAYRKMENHLSELHLAAKVFNNSSEGIFLLDQAFRIVRVNDALARITGYGAAECIGQPLYQMIPVMGEAQGYPRAVEDLGPAGRWEGEVFTLRKDGTPYISWLRLSLETGSRLRSQVCIGMVADITERKEQQKHIQYLATHDPLTELPNRVLLHDRLGQAITRATRSRDMLGVVFLDLDRFKMANDNHGHSFGDKILQEVAMRLRRILRSSDTVARFGGDEFVILTPDLKNLRDAERVLRKIVHAFASPFSISGKEVRLTCSIGFACYPIDGEDAETLLSRADLAMYQAKEAGGNGYAFYTPEMSAAALEQAALEDALHRALACNELTLYFQPIVELNGGRMSGLEALVRWNHPQLGLLSPGRFIPAAEQNGLIVPLGEWVLRSACAHAAAWDRQGLPPIQLAVNVSARQFQQKDFVHTTRRILEETGFDPQRLKLEITESLIMRGAENFIAVLAALRKLGLKLAIDDFGTGYSSLSYLHHFPIDELKIDSSFLQGIGSKGEDATVPRAIISLAHSLGLTVTAEGVETEAQVRFLVAHRCDQAQGYYFAKPDGPEVAVALLRSDHRWPLPKPSRRAPPPVEGPPPRASAEVEIEPLHATLAQEATMTPPTSGSEAMAYGPLAQPPGQMSALGRAPQPPSEIGGRKPRHPQGGEGESPGQHAGLARLFPRQIQGQSEDPRTDCPHGEADHGAQGVGRADVAVGDQLGESSGEHRRIGDGRQIVGDRHHRQQPQGRGDEPAVDEGAGSACPSEQQDHRGASVAVRQGAAENRARDAEQVAHPGNQYAGAHVSEAHAPVGGHRGHQEGGQPGPKPQQFPDVE
jgi:diguanylate cyclase (GGDEF)-like protein/PAS domain S-box-containing protein